MGTLISLAHCADRFTVRIRQPCARESWRWSENHIHEKSSTEFTGDKLHSASMFTSLMKRSEFICRECLFMVSL